VKVVQGLSDRPAGALASARPGDVLIWNDRISIVVGDGVLDAVPIGGEDGLKRMETWLGGERVVVDRTIPTGDGEVTAFGRVGTIEVIERYRLEPESDRLVIESSAPVEHELVTGVQTRETGLGELVVAEGPTTSYALEEMALYVLAGPAAAVTESRWRRAAVPLGEAAGHAPRGAAIAVVSDGHLVTRGRADSAGRFRIALPAGNYRLHAEVAGRGPGPSIPVEVAPGAESLATLPVGEGTTITVRVRDETAQALPARVRVEGAGSDRVEYAGSSGEIRLDVTPGAYLVSVSRGVEYEAWQQQLVVGKGDDLVLDVRLARLVDTSGWIAVDPHLHSELSDDSTIALEDRLLAVAAEGVEVAIATDHDVLADYRPHLRRLGLDEWVSAAVGQEVSSPAWGHFNAWPFEPEIEEPVTWLGRTPGELLDVLAGGGARVVQVNHPRTPSHGFFAQIGLDAPSLAASRLSGGYSLAVLGIDGLQFDAVEVANAYGGSDFERVFADWLALVAAGHTAAATGASDSHGRRSFAGHARTYVHVGDGADDPSTIDLAEVDAALRARRAVVAQGAFVTAGLVDEDGRVTLPGEILEYGGGSRVVLRVRVQAAPWLATRRLRIYQETDEIMTIDLDRWDTRVERFAADLTLGPALADTFFVVRVDPGARGDPVLPVPGPSFTNPLFLAVE
jgi:hypothetical protein